MKRTWVGGAAAFGLSLVVCLAFAGPAFAARYLVNTNSDSGAGSRGRQSRVTHHRYRVTLRLWISYTPTHGRQRDIGDYGLHLP